MVSTKRTRGGNSRSAARNGFRSTRPKPAKEISITSPSASYTPSPKLKAHAPKNERASRRGGALRVASQEGATFYFKQVTFETLVDSPIFAGANVKLVPLAARKKSSSRSKKALNKPMFPKKFEPPHVGCYVQRALLTDC